MDNVDEVVETILKQRKDLTKEAVLKLMENRKLEAGGFLSDEGAARLVAQDVLVKIGGKSSEEVHLEDLVSGLGDVTVTGLVLTVWPLQEFKRFDGTVGKMVRFATANKTGTIHCVAWGSKAQELSNSDVEGKVVRIIHGYTREGLASPVEIHCGERSQIIVSLEGTSNESYLKVENLFTKIGDVSLEKRELNVVGVVKTAPRLLATERGSVLRARLVDDTGTIAIVAWNEKVEELRELSKGDTLQIMFGKAKSNIRGLPEIHIDRRSRTSILKGKPSPLGEFQLRATKISELKPRMIGVDLLARVLAIGQINEVKTLGGASARVGRILLGDETGIVAASLWDEKAMLVEKMKEGDVLLIEEASTRERMGEISVSVGKNGSVEINPRVPEVPYSKVTRLSELAEIPFLVMIEGTIVDTPMLRQVQTSSGETVEVASTKVNDGTGEATVSFWRQLAKKASAFSTGAKVRVIGLRIRPGLAGNLELSSGFLTKIEALG